MIIYILSFGFSALLLFLADNEHLKEKAKRDLTNSTSVILVLLALIIPCLLAGVRDVGIGTDTKGYGIWLFELAHDSNDLASFMESALFDKRRMEPLFALEAYFSAVLMPNSTFLYFALVQASILVPVYFGIRILSNRCSTWYPMLIFYFVFYPFSLNAMRQMIAAAFLFLGFALLIKKKKQVAWWLLFLTAIGFHRTALIGVLIYIIWFMVEKRKSFIFSLKRIFFITCALCILVALFADPVLSVLSKLFPVYATYYNGRDTWGNRVFVAPLFFYSLLIVLLSIGSSACRGERKRDLYFVILVAATSMPVQLLSSVSEPIGRMMWYFFIFVLAIPAINSRSEFAKSRLGLNPICVLLLCLVQFWWFYALNGGSEIIPFSSSLLGL